MGESTSSSVEARTQEWLEESFAPGIIAAHDAGPVFGPDGQPRRMSRYVFGRLLRKLKIVRWLDQLEFDTFLDVASGWEHYPFLARERRGAEGYYSDRVHALNVPDGPAYGKQDHGVTLQLPVLPFRDGAFDVVLCSEVFEHLVRPVETIAELSRVARRYVILTSLEARAASAWRRRQLQWRVDTRRPHVERNFLTLPELRALFGGAAHIENLEHANRMPINPLRPEAEQDALYAGLVDRTRLRGSLCHAISDPGLGAGSMGVLVVKAIGDAPLPRPPSRNDDVERADWVLDKAAFEEAHNEWNLAHFAAIQRDPWRAPVGPDVPAPARPVAPALAARLRCPDCRGELVGDGPAVVCRACATRFAADYGVPILVPGRPGGEPTLAECLERLCGDDATARRSVERVYRRLRRYERPPGLLRRALLELDRVWQAEAPAMRGHK